MSVSTGMAGEKKVVLVVDDAPANISVANQILHDAYKVWIATSGAKALELAAGTAGPDLILLEVVMPGMNCYEVYTHLKSRSGYQGYLCHFPHRPDREIPAIANLAERGSGKEAREGAVFQQAASLS